MRTVRTHSRVACVVGAIALLFQVAPILAEGHGDNDHNSRPVEITFTKWVPVTNVLMTGITGGDVPGDFIGEVLQGQHSANPAVNPNPNGDPAPAKNGISRIEVIYAVSAHDPDRSFTALIRGGQNNVTGVARFEGVVLAGWRSGARVQVVYQRYFAGDAACVTAGVPAGLGCFEGTISLGRAPRD
jgi:hypothetical protein